MSAPHSLRTFKRDEFLEWLESNGATVLEPTNPYEVVRYRKWCEGDGSRPSTHIIYKRKDGSLTYAGQSREHYEGAVA